MKKLQMNKSASITFEDRCNKYLDYCRHSSLAITQNYINLLVSDVKKQVNEVNLLNKFSSKQRVKMKLRKMNLLPDRSGMLFVKVQFMGHLGML